MGDLDARRQALAETRARLDHHLDELVGVVPDKDHLVGLATRVAAAAGGLVVGVATVMLVTRSRLNNRRDRSQAKSYATAVLKAMPEVAAAWQARESLDGVAPALAAEPRTVVERVANLPDVSPATKPVPERGGAPTALLMGLGVVGGVAIAKALGES